MKFKEMIKDWPYIINIIIVYKIYMIIYICENVYEKIKFQGKIKWKNRYF